MTHEFDHGVLYHGDCLDIMPNLPEKSVDMILADLPYGVTECKWDSIIPFDTLWNEYKRIIKNNGVLVFTAQQPFTTDLINSNRKWFRYTWVWNKRCVRNFANAQKMPLKNHEDIVVFYEKMPTYNPQMTYIKHTHGLFGTIKPDSDKSENYGETIRHGHNDRVGGFPRTIIDMRAIINLDKESVGHPTQKPTSLFEYLVLTYTNPGEAVLDNVIGSGTTAIAAYRTGRRWIGIEKDPDIYQMCLERIQKDTQQLKLITTANNKNEADFTGAGLDLR